MSTRYGWDPLDGPNRAFSASKTCSACGAFFWPPKGKSFADFCDPCWAKVKAGTCPRTGCQQPASLAPKGVLAAWPVVMCGSGAFVERHSGPPRREAAFYNEEVPK